MRLRGVTLGIVALAFAIVGCEPSPRDGLPPPPPVEVGKPEPYHGLGIGRDAFTSVIDGGELPLTYGGFMSYDDGDVLMARFHPAPGKTTVSLGMWGDADNLRAVDIECYIDPSGRPISGFETRLCGVLMALVLKITVPEWAERNDWLISTVGAGATTKDVIRRVGDSRGERGLRYFASSYALGLEVSARRPPVAASGAPLP